MLLSSWAYVRNLLANFGGPTRWLIIVVGAIILFAAGYTIQRIVWILEPNKIIEETAPPVMMGFDAQGNPYERTIWNGGETAYIKRTFCIYRTAVGHVHRELIDTVKLPLDSPPLSSQLYLDEEQSKKKRPWCVVRYFPLTLPEAALAPGPVTYAASIVAFNLNPEKPIVVQPWLPVKFSIGSTPVKEELIELHNKINGDLKKAEAEIARNEKRSKEMDAKFNKAAAEVKRLEDYAVQLDAYLRLRKILPREP